MRGTAEALAGATGSRARPGVREMRWPTHIDHTRWQIHTNDPRCVRDARAPRHERIESLAYACRSSIQLPGAPDQARRGRAQRQRSKLEATACGRGVAPRRRAASARRRGRGRTDARDRKRWLSACHWLCRPGGGRVSSVGRDGRRGADAHLSEACCTNGSVRIIHSARVKKLGTAVAFVLKNGFGAVCWPDNFPMPSIDSQL